MQVSQDKLRTLVESYALKDDLDSMQKAVLGELAGGEFEEALKLFLEGRRTIETTWDYKKTLDLYRQSHELLEKLEGTGGIIASWLDRIVESHSQLQKAEADWTLCNFDRSREMYFEASGGFEGSTHLLDGLPEYNQSRLRDYSEGWRMLALGMGHNLAGYSLLKTGDTAEGAKEFMIAKEVLLEAEGHFSRIANSLGQHDARSYVVDGRAWLTQKMFTTQLAEVRWKDFAFFKSNATFDKVLASLNSMQTSYPSELLTRNKVASLKMLECEIGSVELSPIGGLEHPDLDVRLIIHPERVVEIQYVLRVKERTDAFTLYMLKTLNTDAIPSYRASFRSESEKIAIELQDARLKDMTRTLMEGLAKRVGAPDDAGLLDSFVTLQIYDYAPEVDVSQLGKGDFSYLDGIFAETETSSLQPNLGSRPDIDNLFEATEHPGAAAFLSQRFAILLLPKMQEWESKVYCDALDYALQSRETIAKLSLEMQREGDRLGAELLTLRNAVSKNTVVTESEIRELISSNLDVRLRTLRLFEVRQRRDALRQSGIRDVRAFIDRAEQKLDTVTLLHSADSLSERIEALYNTAFNLGQDYLSLTIAMNSEVSRRAFAILNVIMMGSLGLSFATAILKTPISYTYGLFAVFGVAFFGYLYLTYVRRRVMRLWR